MKLEEFNEYFEPVEKIDTPMQKNATVKKDISLSRPDTYSKIEDIESNLCANYNIRTSLIEGDHHSKIILKMCPPFKITASQLRRLKHPSSCRRCHRIRSC